MAWDTLLVETCGDVLHITLNRPDKMNAINIVMLQELHDVLDAASIGARAVLLKGGERAFCAGQDLGDSTLSSAQDAGDVLERLYNPLICRIAGLPLPVIASVRGAVAGAGCSLALAADFVIAANTARFDMAFVRLGLVPDCGATYILPRLVGQARARGMMMLGEPVSGEMAADWGLIWKALPDEAVDKGAEDLANRLAAGPTQALDLIKQAGMASATNDLGAQLDLEQTLQVKAAATEDFSEGLAAFRDKRPPEFNGR